MILLFLPTLNMTLYCMLNYFVQVQMTRKDNLCVQLTYHNIEKGQVS